MATAAIAVISPVAAPGCGLKKLEMATKAITPMYAAGRTLASQLAMGASDLCGSSSLRKALNYSPKSYGAHRRVSSSAIRASASENGTGSGGVLPIDLRGKKAFVAGVADDQGFGWAISKALAEAGAEIILGTWVPALGIFETSLKRGKFDDSRKLARGGMLEFAKVYPMDAVFDTPEDVPEDVKANKRYAGNQGWTVSEVAESVKKDFGSVDIVIHSLANGPEVQKPLLETSRKGYLAALSASSYSLISMVQRFSPMMAPGGSIISLTYIAAERTIPGYGGGMASAKAALEADTKYLAWEAGRKYGVRVNTISAGPLGSRAAKAIGFIDRMINYSASNAPLQKELFASEVGNAAAFLASPLASAITGVTLYVDNGLHSMGVAVDSPCVSPPVEEPKPETVTAKA